MDGQVVSGLVASGSWLACLGFSRVRWRMWMVGEGTTVVEKGLSSGFVH